MIGAGEGRNERPRDEAALPPEIVAVIERVLAAADLDRLEGGEDVARELRAHFEDGLAAGTPAQELVERFGDPEAAGRRIARARSAAARSSADQSAARWWTSLHEWCADVARAARRLVRAPGFSAIVVLTLALGVGANTAIFTVLDAVLLDDLPYPDADRLVRVYEGRVDDPAYTQFLRGPVLAEYRSWDEIFASFGAVYTYREVGADLTDGDSPLRVSVVRVSAGYFEALGVPPERGRAFLEEESFGPGESGGTTDLIAAVAVIGHDLWSDHFGSDPDIVGRTIRLDDAPFEVVGVMPARFVDPIGAPGEVWIPQDLRAGGSNHFGNYYLSAIARLRPGVSLEAARQRADVLAQAFGEAQPEAEDQRPRIVALQQDVVGSTRATMLWILAAAAALVLLTACLNVANLLLARGLGQDRQLALRSALGSGRARLVAGILLENALLACAGGLAGVLFGWVGLRSLLTLAPDALPSVIDPGMGSSAFLYALVVTVAALLAFGLAPALRLSRTAPAEVLRSGDRTATSGRISRRIRDGLVVVQVAAALVLVAGATMLARSFHALASVPLAVDPEGVLTFEVHLPTARYPDGPTRHAFHDRLHERLRDLPGVASVGATSWLPVNGRYHTWSFAWDVEHAATPRDGTWNASDVRIVAGDYFDVMDIDLLNGSRPDEVDLDAEPVLWIDATIADQVFGDVDPIGQQVWISDAERRVVGVVEDVPHGARGETSRTLYIPHAQFSDDRNWALIQTVRTRGSTSALREAVADEIATLDPALVLHRPQSFIEVLATARAQDRFATALMGAFAALALLLALLGTYGVLAGSVASRTREIGIRMALGADTRRVRNMVLRYAGSVTTAGIALGVLGAWAGGRWIETLLFAIEPGDPLTFGLAVAVFVGVGLLSGWLPARRATRVDTVRTLSAE